MREKDRQHSFRILQHIIIPESVHPVAARLKPIVPLLVASAPIVLSAIKFDDQPFPCAEQIDDIGTDRRLPAELEPFKPPIAQQIPHPPLRLGLILPQPRRSMMLARHVPQPKIPLSP